MMSLRSARALGMQRRNFTPCIAITGLPSPLANQSNGSRSFVAWESIVQPKDQQSLEKYGPIAERANFSKLSDPGIDSADVVEFNSYPEGSAVARNDRLGKDVEDLMYGYPVTEEAYLKKYLKPRATDDYERRVKHYAMLAVPRSISAFMAKSFVCGLVLHMGPRADMKALASIEADISALEDGEMTVVVWRGKPCFVHKRTEKQIAEAENTPIEGLRDPQTDQERHKDKNYAVMIAICTHLGCIPVFGEGDYKAYFCPCHGSHYDLSGRIRKGPAPLNLEVPPYYYPEDGVLCIGLDAAP
eukprot:TRINITY_DN787_c0_g4_i1.p1 TRINITY_DN787_c0_g4~~TRINITY_DN787_c0_g4_i1.p1  ORF type:complete len:301 (+),score=54.19 TRINITY_DN787_c0_g4_i1:44-946(+)